MMVEFNKLTEYIEDDLNKAASFAQNYVNNKMTHTAFLQLMSDGWEQATMCAFQEAQYAAETPLLNEQPRKRKRSTDSGSL